MGSLVSDSGWKLQRSQVLVKVVMPRSSKVMGLQRVLQQDEGGGGGAGGAGAGEGAGGG